MVPQACAGDRLDHEFAGWGSEGADLASVCSNLKSPPGLHSQSMQTDTQCLATAPGTEAMAVRDRQSRRSLWFAQSPPARDRGLGSGNLNQMIAFMFRLMRDQSNTSRGPCRVFAPQAWASSQHRCARHHADRRFRRPGHS